jgi:LAS superfamily LD-carboxypeptidase LdcB
MMLQKQISFPAGNRFIIVWWVFMISACAVKTENQPVTQEDSLAQQVVSTDEEKLDKKNILENPLSIVELLGKMEPTRHADFIKIKDEHTDKSNIYLRKATYEAFQQMYEAAAQEGIQLKIISATRNFADQKRIWENKWNGSTKVGGEDLSKTIADPAARALKILEYSSMPGTSRHHWGTDIDLNNLNNAWFVSGEGKKIYDWLQTHAGTYGFCQPYSEKGTDRPDGYNEEKWHWSYMPLAHPFLQQYSEKVSYEEVMGFAGAEEAVKIQAIDKYVEGIAPTCKHWTD